MKIVLDTNVFISGIFFSGPPSQILQAWKNKKLRIILSQDILDEYHRVAESLSSKYPTIDIFQIIELVTVHGQFVDTTGLDITICEDPDDNKFIECAIASDTKIIVSGDNHLLKITGYQGITILKPREFVDRYLN
ncbi:MAG: putative toxin-antitoxin system toxin component, PIN family [Deltaproteobacteria bacterium]|nr:putative toxin-antitoxin system toxin component, PIN family [Candidatus Tharpellaceae bacterium]